MRVHVGLIMYLVQVSLIHIGQQGMGHFFKVSALASHWLEDCANCKLQVWASESESETTVIIMEQGNEKKSFHPSYQKQSLVLCVGITVPLDVLGHSRHCSLHHPRPVNISHWRSQRTVVSYNLNFALLELVFRIRIKSRQWIRIRIQEGKNEPQI